MSDTFNTIKSMITSVKSFTKGDIKKLILIPTLIGGLYQFCKLISIGLSYVSFFSISQVLADGLMWSIIFSIFLIISFTFSYAQEKIKKLKNKHIPEGKNKKAFELLFDIGIVIIILAPTFLLYFISNLSSWALLIIYLLLTLVLTFPLVVIFLLEKYLPSFFKSTSKEDKVDNEDNEDNKDNKDNEINFKFKLNTFLMLFIATIVVMCFMFFSSYLNLPKNNINKERLYKKIKAKDSNIKEVEILYYNDKYLFTEIKYKCDEKEKSNKIEVLELKELFIK